MADRAFQRTTERPTVFFRLSALQMAGSLGMEIARVDTLLAVLYGSLGTEWLDYQAEDVPSSTPLPFARHPIGRLIAAAGPPQVTEALEVAECIERLYDVPGIGEVLAQLKAEGQYWQTLCHLTVASRLRREGAIGVRLEPPVADGQLSDVSFEVGSRRYHAECYRPTYTAKGDERNEQVRLAQDLLGLAGQRRLVVSFALSLTTVVTPELRKELVSAAKDALDGIQDDVIRDERTFPCLSLEGEFGILSVCRALPTPSASEPKWIAAPHFPHKDKEPPLFIRASVSREEDLTGLDLKPERGVGLSHVAMWGGTTQETSDADADLERLGRKLERKLRQTRGSPGVGRILIADAKESLLLDSPTHPHSRRLHGKLVQQHADIAAVVMIKRPSQPRTATPVYHAVPLYREGIDPELVRLIERAFPPQAGST